MKPSPYITKNTAIAISLQRILGSRPDLLNIYSPHILQKHGCETVKDALDRGVRGEIHYVFEHDPRIAPLLNAWGQRREDRDRGVATELANITPQEAMMLCFDILKDREEIQKDWPKAAPMLREMREGDIKREHDETTGETRITYPGFTIVGAYAPEPIKRHVAEANR